MTIDGHADEWSFNPFDPSQTRSSWEKLARFRRECPVSRPFDGLVYTAKYDDTRDVFRDGRRFSFGAAGMRKPGAVVPYEERFLGEIDAPEHPPIRKLLHRYFTPGMAASEEPFARAYIRKHFEAIAAKGGAEMVEEFSSVMPIAITAHVIGLSIDDVDHISRDMLDLQQADSFLDGNIGVTEAFPKLSVFVDAAIDERLSSASPPDDVMSTMLFGEINGSRMSRTQVRTLAVNLLSGSSSTTSLLDNLFYRDLIDSEFDTRLRADRSLIPRAVEESLRLEPPVLFLFRTTLGDTELSGTPVHAGERICMGIGSANRDEDRYAASGEFNIERTGEPEHLSFGWGGHLCLGIHLARMEAKVALEEWLELFPAGGVSLAEGFDYEFPKDDFLRYGPERLDIVVDRTTRPV